MICNLANLIIDFTKATLADVAVIGTSAKVAFIFLYWLRLIVDKIPDNYTGNVHLKY